MLITHEQFTEVIKMNTQSLEQHRGLSKHLLICQQVTSALCNGCLCAFEDAFIDQPLNRTEGALRCGDHKEGTFHLKKSRGLSRYLRQRI